MTPEEETALRSQVAQLRAALMSVYVSHQELHSNPVLTETIEEPAWAALDATADSEKWLAEHDAKLLVAGRMENRSAAYRILGEPEQADFSSALAAHDTRVRADARADERTRLEEEWNLSVAIASFPKTPSMVEIIETHDVEVRADARRAAIEAAAKLIREHLLPNSQRAISWHEAADCLEAVFALKRQP